MTSPVLFQFMPPLLPSEYQALAESIRAHGVQVPVIVDENGAIIDGHHRDQIATELGVHCPREVRTGLSGSDKRSLAISLNKDRRHLTREQVRALIGESVKADPSLSDREHARRVGVDHKTVGSVREGLIGRGEVPHIAERTDSLGRQQPATKPERINPATGEVVPGPTYRPTDVTDWTPQEVDDLIDADERELEAWKASTVPAPPKVVGLDGKTYTRPEKPSETAARVAATSAEKRDTRRPLPDAFWESAYDLTKKAEALLRMTTDDRFPRNREAIAAKNLHALQQTANTLARVLAAIES